MKKVSASPAAESIASTTRCNDGIAASSADFDDRTRICSIHFMQGDRARGVPVHLINNFHANAGLTQYTASNVT